jgi:ABC-2 type transport system ATP-binding protein
VNSHDAITVHSLALRYDEVTVLHGIDLAVPRGAVVGLVGRNGAGKSSLLRCLVGLSVPQSGQACLFGEPTLALSDAVRETLGYVGQQPDLLGWLTVWEHVRYIGSFYSNFSEHRARDLLIRLGLGEGRRVSQLSGGDAQKLCIVLALAHDPSLLIMDEPVSSLDPMTRREFLRALFDSPGQDDDPERRTIVLSSHLLTDLERVVSHWCFLREGQVQWFGERDELPTRLAQVQTAQPLALQPGLVSQRRAGSGWQAVIDRLRFSGALPNAQPLKMSLEDLFMEVNA